MRFVTNPQLILTKDEFDTLNRALQLCRDMDKQTGEPDTACTVCPFQDDCTHLCSDCVYERAYNALHEIVNVAIIK